MLSLGIARFCRQPAIRYGAERSAKGERRLTDVVNVRDLRGNPQSKVDFGSRANLYLGSTRVETVERFVVMGNNLRKRQGS